MVTHDELIKLAKQSEKSFGVEQEQLISFVKNGAVRAYKAGSAGPESEDVLAEFNAQSKQLRLVVAACNHPVKGSISSAVLGSN